MLAIVTPDEMHRIDLTSGVPIEVLIERAGAAVAQAAIELLGGTYGKRVVVLVGKGNNGADGLVAARRLRSRGVHVTVVDAHAKRPELAPPQPCDLVIDAILGTGARPGFTAPALPADATVLAVDGPSGLDLATGSVPNDSSVLQANCTVTFAALKPGHLFGEGRRLCGDLRVADIGLDVPFGRTSLLEAGDIVPLLPTRRRDAHKWTSSVLVVGGAPGMTGAPTLAAGAAQRTGAGMVRVAVPGDLVTGAEWVGVPVPSEQWSAAVIALAERMGAVVIGPGLGRAGSTRHSIRQTIAKIQLPMVIDADALVALGGRLSDPEPDVAELLARAAGSGTTRSGSVGAHAATHLGEDRGATGDVVGRRSGRTENANMAPGQRAVLQATARRMGATATAAAALGRVQSSDLEVAVRSLAGRPANATVLTPHDGEFERLVGHRPAQDAGRIEDACRLAGATGAVVVLKGPATVIAAPDGRAAVCTEGDERLATAGSGDVLAGVIGSFLAQGLQPFDAARTAVFVHGRAARLGPRRGLVAGDLVRLVPEAMSDCETHAKR